MAMSHRMAHLVDKLDAKAHDLAPLEIGDKVKVQNQTGPSKTRWFRTGMIMEINLPHDMYHVLMDGSRRTTARNRKFLRKIRTIAPPDYDDGRRGQPRQRRCRDRRRGRSDQGPARPRQSDRRPPPRLR